MKDERFDEIKVSFPRFLLTWTVQGLWVTFTAAAALAAITTTTRRALGWFALIGFLAIAITSIGGMEGLKKIAVPLFHGVAGLVIFLGPFLAKGTSEGFWWVGIGGALIGIGGIALAFLTAGSQLLFFSTELVLTILAPLLLLMTLAFAWGFTKDILASTEGTAPAM